MEVAMLSEAISPDHHTSKEPLVGAFFNLKFVPSEGLTKVTPALMILSTGDALAVTHCPETDV
jgi:hypothetical protein